MQSTISETDKVLLVSYTHEESLIIFIVTVQYLHSYEAKSIKRIAKANCLWQFDFCNGILPIVSFFYVSQKACMLLQVLRPVLNSYFLSINFHHGRRIDIGIVQLNLVPETQVALDDFKQ